MSISSKVFYQGKLRTQAIHLNSSNEIITDAPIDNNGKGEAFSPTDLLAASLASCALTLMGIKAQSLGFDLEEASAEVVKIMESSPRRVSEVKIVFSLKQNCDDHQRLVLEKTAATCPVAKSLSKDLIQTLSFRWK